MRVTISKTIELGEIPSEIDELYESITERLVAAQSALNVAVASAKEGRYVESSENAEALRQILVIIDKNLEESQSLSLSYEQLRISNQMPEKQTAKTSPMVEAKTNE